MGLLAKVWKFQGLYWDETIYHDVMTFSDDTISETGIFGAADLEASVTPGPTDGD